MDKDINEILSLSKEIYKIFRARPELNAGIAARAAALVMGDVLYLSGAREGDVDNLLRTVKSYIIIRHGLEDQANNDTFDINPNWHSLRRSVNSMNKELAEKFPGKFGS